jgi:hypothetical protein
MIHSKIDELNSVKLNKDKSAYFIYLDDLTNLYKKVQHILLVSLNDVFLQNNLNNLTQDKLILDTIQIIKQNNYDLNKILKIYKSYNDNPKNDNNNSHNHNENLFTNYSIKCQELLSSKLIEYPQTNPFNTNTDKKNKFKFKSKKNYEVEKLSEYMLNIINKENIKNLIEMGCGKSYLTDSILLNDDMVYIGLDRKDDLIEKSIKSNKKNNIYVLNHNITLKNFNQIFEEQIMLFGLHSCGNLTSDTIKIFFQNDSFSHLVIVGCCLNLLKEYISEDVEKSSDMFKSYINSIGYDNKGNYLEETLLYEYDYEQVGFPLSSYLKNKTDKDFFLTRTVRNASMQTFPKNEDSIINSKDNLFYKKIYYRTILQAFFEKYFEELKNFYGYGKIEIKVDNKYDQYMKIVFKNLNKILKDRGNKQYDTKIMIEKLIIKEDYFNTYEGLNLINEFVKKCGEFEDILWAVYLIRLRFAKIIEYIIALDRVIFMLENGISEIHLVKIFDESVSVRNILIYATK